MLAQIAQTGFWSVMANVALVASIVGNIAMVIMLRRNKETRTIEPQPFDVRMIERMATEKECKERFESTQREIAEMRNRREADMNAGSLSRRAIYEEIRRSNLESVNKIEAVRKELSDQMTGVQDRIIATLRNFGAIGGKGH